MATSFNADYLIEAGQGVDASASGVMHHAASVAAAGFLGIAMVVVVGVGVIGAGAYAVYEPVALYRKRRRDARAVQD